MRIALVGDLQYWSIEEENIIPKMKEIGSLEPDFAVIMGDTGGPKCTSIDGYRDTAELAKNLKCPYHLIFGNHDVECCPEEYDNFYPEADYKEIFGSNHYRSFVLNGVLLICISVEKQPKEMMRTVHGVYVSDEQFKWVENELISHKGMPTVIIAHAPVIGNGFRCFRPMHTSSQDTYLDHTYNAKRWPALLKNYPQIKAWCSAHFHMGHDYDTAITYKYGVTHISCSVITDSRDGSCQTRIMDITDDQKILVSTFDHSENTFKQDAVIDLTVTEKPSGRVAVPIQGEILLGDDEPVNCWCFEKLGRYFISTKNKVLWDYDYDTNEFLGALTLEHFVDELYVSGDRLIMCYEGKVGSVDVNSRDRFDCMAAFAPQKLVIEDSIYGTPLPRVEFTTRLAKEGLYISVCE